MTFALKSVHHALFKARVVRTRAAFRAACAPFFKEIAALEKEASAFQARVDAGSAQWEECDEETGASWSYGEELSERRSDAEDALLTIRKAFAIMTYHLWERGALRWAPCKTKSPNHADLIAALTAATIAVDAKSLGELKKLANCLKHNSTRSGPDLYADRPDFFDGNFDPNAIHPATGKPFSRIEWADNIALTDGDIEQFLTTVLNSSQGSLPTPTAKYDAVRTQVSGDVEASNRQIELRLCFVVAL